MTAICPAGPPKDSRPMRNQVRVASANDTGDVLKACGCYRTHVPSV